MEEKKSPFSISEDEFSRLIHLAQQNNNDAIVKLINFFKEDIIHLSRFIKMPQEDAVQSMIVELIELFKKRKAR
ncbi:helix-turn-helix domain-containing protein [Paenibacillus sp. ACRRX]|uniref:helix-turn-helix domain-containing protein n=1 Tax=unclassified Paenibacillus TaxID=185978 RepID=UPI001EF6C738|nr:MULTISPECIES: helix-turn-helix domain-containing protein [unclassified Paenibacillus]MCG7408569.1 helix-turn-helix domain-containing protein [Paenibacillus sp. ACRRX]MDK8182817.1 helix-turn-helix domain-containing protein [Paenibacillus sp. UMB4589-SE434]